MDNNDKHMNKNYPVSRDTPGVSKVLPLINQLLEVPLELGEPALRSGKLIASSSNYLTTRLNN